MPIYSIYGESYEIPDDRAEEFEKENPNANIDYSVNGEEYSIPLNQRESFLADFPDATSGSPQQKPVETAPQPDASQLQQVGQQVLDRVQQPDTSWRDEEIETGLNQKGEIQKAKKGDIYDNLYQVFGNAVSTGKPGDQSAYAQTRSAAEQMGIGDMNTLMRLVGRVNKTYAKEQARKAVEDIVAKLPERSSDPIADLQSVYYDRDIQKRLHDVANAMGNDYEDIVNKFVKPQLAQAMKMKYGGDDNEWTGVRGLHSNWQDVNDRWEREHVGGMLGDIYDTTIKDALDAGEARKQQVLSEKMPGFEIGSIINAAGSKAGAFMEAGRKAVQLTNAYRQANKAADPDNILQSLIDNMSGAATTILQDEKTFEDIWQRASAKGMDVNEYIDKYVAPQMQQALVDRFEQEAIRREMPKDTKDYILNGLKEDNVAAMLFNSITRTAAQNRYASMADMMTEEGKNPNVDPGLLAEGARLATGMAADFWLWGGWGKIGGKATEALLSRRLTEIAARRGLTEAAAREVLMQEAKHNLKDRALQQVMQHIPQSVIMGTGASTTTGVARDIKNNEDVGTIISNAIRELPGHALTFTAFGGANALTNSISANWKGWKKLLGKALGYEGSALTLYGTGEMSKKMNGQDAFEQIPRGLLKAHIDQLAMHFASNPGRAVADLYKAVRHPVKWAGTSDAEKMKGVLTEEDVADLMESADGKALWEVLSDMKPDVSTEALKDGTAPGAYGTEETAARLADWLNNKDRPADRKRRVGSLLGFVVPKKLETTSDNLKLADDGSVMLRTRDKDGNCVQELHFDTVDEADKWQQDHQRQLEMNDMLELWNGTDADRRMAAVLKMMEATGLQKPGDIQAIFEGRGDAEQTAALYDALKQVAVRVDEPNAPRFYEEGRQLSPEEQHDASVKEQRIFRLIEGQGADFAADVLAGRDNPDVSLPQIREKYGDVKARMATIYYNNYARTKGVMDEIGTAVDSAIKAANERVYLNSHPSGNVVTVDIQGTKAYLTDGDVTVNADGTVNANGHDTVIVRDAETGAVKMVPPGDIEVTGIYKDSDLVRQNEEMIRQQIEQTALDNVKYAPGTPDQAILGDIYTGADGMRYMVLADENGRMVKVALDENGDPIEGQMQPFDLEEYRTAKSAEIDAKEYGDDQIDIPDLEPAETSGGDRIPLEDNEEAETTQKQPVYQIPTNEKGQPDFENALPEQTRQFFVDKYGEEKASSMFARLAENSKRAYDKLVEKGYPDTTDPNELMAYEDELDAAKAKAEYWNGLASKKEEPVQQPVTEEKAEQPKVEEAPKIEKGQINDTETGQNYAQNPPENIHNEAQTSETEQETNGQTMGQKGGKNQQAKPAEPVTPPVQEPTAEQKIAQGTVKRNIGKRFGFRNPDGKLSEIVIDSFKGDDMVTVTRQDYDSDGKPLNKPYKQDLDLVDVGKAVVNGVMKPVLSTEEKLREAYKGMKGIQNLIDVMSEDEMQKMLEAHQKGDKEALDAMKVDLYDTHREDMILKNRDNRNDKVSRIMNGTAGREEKLRRVRKEYQGFEDAVVALSDEAMQPTTLEEYVADLHSRQPKSGEGPIAYFSYDQDGKKVVGLQDETGHGTKSGGDTKGYAPWLAPKGKGMSLKQYAENIHSQLPEAIQEQYSDQDVRNAILELFGGAERPSDITTMVIRRGIIQAEQAARRMEDMWIEGGPDLHRVSPDDNTFAGRLARAKEQTNTEPSEAQKEKGNYKKGHISFGGYDFVMENPEGTFRRGTDKSGKSWEQKMNNTYGYILGKKGKDGDHLDMFINDAQDLDNWDGKVFVIDQVDPETGKFDEHKIMYGFDSEADARDAYLSNYEEGWQGLGKITGVDKETFDKWLDSSDRKIKEFSEHSITKDALSKSETREATKAEIDKALMTELGNELKNSGVPYTDNMGEGQQIIDNYNSRMDQGSDSELIRPQKVTDQQTLDELEKGPTVKRYRAMQLIDGKLYPPMSAKVDGEMREPTEIGVWEQAEERPDLIKNGKFVLNKGQKGQGNVPAAYNPYFHTSTSGLNDQFTSAYKRPELVVVEVEIPESELTSGYKAEGAKDAVGNVDWHSGVVNGQLPADRQRQVTLSRYSKVNRIVPDSEVADMIAKQLEGTNIEVPYNVVTPALRAELEKRGVKIGEKPAGSVTEDINGNRLRQQKVEQPIFVSNAMKAVEGIGQEKATPDQWLAMIQKNGGLKAGEDKWLGLSDWLNEQKEAGKKSITKQEVEDYIRQNQIQVEEETYKEYFDLDNNPKMMEFRKEFDELVDKYNKERDAIQKESEAFGKEMYDKYGEGWVNKLDEADKKRDEDLTERYRKLNDEDPQELAFQDMVDQYGDNFAMGFEVNYGNGKLEAQMDMYGDGLSGAAKHYLEFEEQPINSTRLSYTTGGLDNKKEIALTVPTIEPYNEGDEIHFGDAGGGRAVAWIRFGDTTVSDKQLHNQRYIAEKEFYDFLDKMSEKYGTDGDGEHTIEQLTPEEKEEAERLNKARLDAINAEDATTKKVLVIDEIQSKRHQDGRSKGYKDKHLQELDERDEEAQKEYHRFLWDKDKEYGYDLWYLTDGAREQYGSKSFDYDSVKKEDIQKAHELHQAMLQASKDLEDYRKSIGNKTSDVPDAPFEKNWHELAMKRMLRYAAENGYDKIAWTTGEQQADRYDLSHQIDEIQSIRNGGGYQVSAMKDGKTVFENWYDSESKLAEDFGKDIANKVFSNQEVGNKQSFKGLDLKVGGEGMAGFYDQILPRFMDKYGKKWGVKTGEIELPQLEESARKMHSIDVTPEMKESVMQGQPMFFKTPDGHAYGFTYKGKIYVDPRIATAETPIHEYGHLWAEMKRQTAKDEWDHIKDVLLHDKLIEPFIEKVRREYPELSSEGKEDDFVEEVLTQFSGKHGAEKLHKMAEEIKAELGNDAAAETIAQAAIRKVKSILNEFWKGVADMMGWKYTTAEDIADAVLRDMLNGVNPVEKMREAPKDLKSQQEIERTLMGVHNISEEKLRKALKQGGLANPSMAVIDTKNHMHTDYGEISLIPKSSLIDSRTGRNAGTFTADAWTPSYPQVVRRMTDKGQSKFWKDLRKLNETSGDLGSQMRMAFDTWLDKEVGQERLAYWYLTEKGLNPEIVMNKNPYDKKVADRLEELTDNGNKMVSSLPEDQIKEIADMYHAYKESIGEPVTPAEERIKKIKERMDPNKPSPFLKLQQWRIEELQKYGELLHSLSDFDNRVRMAAHEEGKPDVYETMRKAQEAVKSQDLQADFEKWLDQKAKDYGVEEWLFNGTDYQGRQKWVRNTLDNASRLMKKEGLNGAVGWSNIGSWIATVANKEKTLAGIRRNKKNLNTSEEQHDAWREQWAERLYSLVDRIGNGDPFSGDRILKDILEHNDFAGYYKREYGKELTKEEKDLINTFIKEVRTNFPTGYFETKFERPVGLEEFEVAVVPETTSPDIVEALKNAGLDVRTYDASDHEAKDENRRKAAMDAVQGRDDIMFQLMGKKGAAEADKTELFPERMDNLRIAEESEKAGVDAKAIKLATGWERGADGKWRYEIPDADVNVLEKYQKKSEEMKKRGVSRPMPIFRLEDLLGKDNEVFNYYPEMRRMNVLFSNILPDGTAGMFDGKNIEINSKETSRFEGDDLNNENVYGTLLHEVQHAIQDIEGFARGGNLQTSTTGEGIKAIVSKKRAEEDRLYKKIEANYNILDNPKELKAAAELDGRTVEEERQNIKDMIDDLSKQAAQIGEQIEKIEKTKAPARTDAIDLYNRLAGEVEARNVTNRMALNDIGKRQTLASVTEDVPREDQVIIMEDGTAMNINDIKPIGTNRFGGIYDQFKGKVKEAFDFLTKKKEGYLKGVFHRDDLGDIDLAWGSAPTDYTGKGLAHIIRKHIKVLKDFKDIDEAMRIIDDVVTNGTSKPNNDPRLVDIEKDNYRVVVAKNDEGNWILSAFDFVTPKKEKGKTLPPSKTPGQSDVEAGAVTSNLSLSGGKDMKNSDTIQEKSEKSSEKAPKFQKVGDDTHSNNFKNFFGDWEKEPEKASKIVDQEGKPMVLYHQTDNDFTVFEPRHEGAGTSDFETPFGIFMKPTSKDIGVRGNKQMPLYANIRNPFEVENRRVLSEALKKNVPGYKELLDEYNRIDQEYSERFKEAEKFDHDKNVENWNKKQRGEITEEEYENSYSFTEEKVLDEWREAIKKPMSDMKELLDKWFRDSEYDGVIIRNNEGSFGRKTETIIALEPNQVKSATENVGTYDKGNPDIRFQRVSNPEPELTEEERQYWKKWDADMKKWKERNAIPADMNKTPDKPAWVQGEPVMDFAKRMAEWNKQRSLWQTAPKLKDYRQMRSDKDTLDAAKEELKKYPDSPMAKMRMAAAEFQQIRSAMGRQKAYDKATVKAVTDFAQEYMKMGFGDNLSRGEMERMLSSVKNATGAKDIRKEVDNIMNILTDNYLRNLDQQVQKLSSVKELKQTAQGVEAQGKLELKGQRMIQAFREARQTRMTADEIRERMAEVSEKMTRNDEEAPMWEQEYEGLSIALQYMDNIEASRSEWGALDREYKDAVKNYKESGLSHKEQQEYLEELDKAMMENKLERIGMFGEIIGRLQGNIAESMQGAKEFTEREKQRIANIQKMANTDLAGKDMGAMRVRSGRPANFFLQPLGTFEQMLKMLGGRNVKGEGNLYNYFMRNWMESTNKAYLGERKAKEELDEKAREVFGDNIKRWSDLYELTGNEKEFPGMDVEIIDQNEPKTFHLTQGNLLYIYMANKMNDGAMKLRKMGITEEDVNAIKEHLDPRLVQLGDWLQDEYLPSKRTEYNKVHERMFGAPMAAIDHYFPIRILGDARVKEEDVNVPDSETLPSTITGNIIKRRRNALPLDILHTDALSLAIEHIEDMERWAATAEWNKDINTLLSYTTFRNKVKNMDTIYGSGDALWNAFKDAAKMAAGTYDSKAKAGGVDKAISNIAKGVTAAKINFRPYTALKQLLSTPAFLTQGASYDNLARYFLNPKNYWRDNFKWAIENMPVFKKRWESRQTGDTRLMENDTDWNVWRKKWTKELTRRGMWLNAGADALTIAAGARAIYETKHRKYVEMGASEEEAHKRAIQDAEIGYNLTQQSSEGAFVSKIQMDRTVAANMLSVFRNSSMSYTRQWVDAARNLNRMSQKGYKDDSIAFMTRQFQDQLGLSEEQAREAAEAEYKRAGRNEVAKLLNMMFGVTVAWNLGASLPYLLLGDDDKTKKEMMTDALMKGLLAGPTEGLAGGNIISDFVGLATNEGVRRSFKDEGALGGFGTALDNMGEHDINPLPLFADIERMISKLGYDGYAAAQDLFNICAQSAVGVNPQTFTDMWEACMDYGNPSWMPLTDDSVGNKDLSNANEIALFIMRVMNAPASSWKNKYIDELGMDAEDAKKLPYEEMARRYANYKHWKDAPLMGWLRGEEARNAKIDKLQKQFDKAVQERMDRLTDREIQDNLVRSESIEERRKYAKMIAQRLGMKPDANSQKADENNWYQMEYQRHMLYDDIAEDLLLAEKKTDLYKSYMEGKEEAARKSAIDENEYVKANKDRKKRLDEAKTEIEKRLDWIRDGKYDSKNGRKGKHKDPSKAPKLLVPGKRQLETTEDEKGIEDIMENIRKWRKEALQLAEQADTDLPD